MFQNKLPQLSLFLDPTQFTSLFSINKLCMKVTWSRLTAVVAEAWVSFVSTEYRTKVRFVVREIKFDVTLSYVKRQTAKMKLLPSVFSSLNNRVKIFVFAANSRIHFSIFM